MLCKPPSCSDSAHTQGITWTQHAQCIRLEWKLKVFSVYNNHNSLGGHSGYICHEPFSFMMSLLAMSFGDRFCFSRKGRIGEVSGRNRRVQTAWPHLGSSLEVTCLALGGPFPVLFGINGVRNKQSHLVGPPFPAFKACFSATADWHFSRDLSTHLLIGRRGQNHVSVKNGWNYLWEQFWA